MDGASVTIHVEHRGGKAWVMLANNEEDFSQPMALADGALDSILLSVTTGMEGDVSHG